VVSSEYLLAMNVCETLEEGVNEVKLDNLCGFLDLGCAGLAGLLDG